MFITEFIKLRSQLFFLRVLRM